jgi:hypothetical protein
VTEPWEERVLATFLDRGRLVQIPARRKKRLVVLRWLADHFRPAERYTEAQVNDLLRRYHEDVATLRRLMVDEELMQRGRGMYWRAGTLPRRRGSDARLPLAPVDLLGEAGFAPQVADLLAALAEDPSARPPPSSAADTESLPPFRPGL